MVLVPSNVVWKVFANLPTRDFSFLPLHFGWNSGKSVSWEQTINKHYERSTGHLKATCSEYEHTCLHLPTFCLHSLLHVSWRWECVTCWRLAWHLKKSVVIHELGTMHHWIRGFKYQLFMWITIGYLKKAPKSCWDFMNSHQNSPVNTIELPRFLRKLSFSLAFRLWRPLRRRWPRCGWKTSLWRDGKNGWIISEFLPATMLDTGRQVWQWFSHVFFDADSKNNFLSKMYMIRKG